MKVLFFADSRPNFGNSLSGNNSGGWTGMLIRGLARRSGLEVGVSYLSRQETPFIDEEHIYFFPIPKPKSFPKRIASSLFRKREDERALRSGLELCKTFKPDAIVVFGCAECPFGLLATRTDIPVLIHIQGIMSTCVNAWLPPGFGPSEVAFAEGVSLSNWKRRFLANRFINHAMRREQIILSQAKHLIGHSQWDQRYADLFAPRAAYYHCPEIARSIFYEMPVRRPSARPLLVTTIGGPLYKGHDTILKTAKVLVNSGLRDFEWKVFGISEMRIAERICGINAGTVNVHPCGKASAETIRKTLLEASLYVHTSYIENRCAAICEAQLSDVPVVATNVGGVPSSVLDPRTTILVPANDPYGMAWTIREFLRTGISSQLSGLEKARVEHNPDSIVSRMLDIIEKAVAET